MLRTLALLLLLLATLAPAMAAFATFDPETATQSYLDQIPSEVRARSDAYFTGGYWLDLGSMVYDLAVAWLLLASGGSARWRDLLAARLRWPTLRTAAFVASYAVAIFVLTFPFQLYRGFFREHAYGFANQDFSSWFGEELIELAVTAVALALTFTLLYAIVRRLQRTWWLWGTAVSVALLAFFLFIAPVFIAPLFNTYAPMPDGPIKQDVLRLARANGIPADDVFVVDDSRQHNRVSARVSGLGSTVRISLNDNLLQRASPQAVVAVMGHEMGHYVLNHVWELLLVATLLFAASFFFVHGSYAWVRRRWGQRFGIGEIGDEAGFPLVMVLLSLAFYLATPVTNTLIRTNETEADYFGLNAAQQPDGIAEALLLTVEYRKAEPGRWEEILFYDHPSPRTRLWNAMQWKAAQLEKAQAAAPPAAQTHTDATPWPQPQLAGPQGVSTPSLAGAAMLAPGRK